MISDYGMEKTVGADELFMRKRPDSAVGLLVANMVDDFFLVGKNSEKQLFFDYLDRTFTLGTTSVSSNLRFLGCKVDVNPDGSDCTGIHRLLAHVKPLSIFCELHNSPHATTDDLEKTEYRTLVGKVLYLGQQVLPQRCMVDVSLDGSVCTGIHGLRERVKPLSVFFDQETPHTQLRTTWRSRSIEQ